MEGYLGKVTYFFLNNKLYSPLADLFMNITPLPIRGYAVGPGNDHEHSIWRKMLCLCSKQNISSVGSKRHANSNNILFILYV